MAFMKCWTHDGSLSNGTVFFDNVNVPADGEDVARDGMKIDPKGRSLYVSDPGLCDYLADGQHLGTMPPEQSAQFQRGAITDARLYPCAQYRRYKILLNTPGIRTVH